MSDALHVQFGDGKTKLIVDMIDIAQPRIKIDFLSREIFGSITGNEWVLMYPMPEPAPDEEEDYETELENRIEVLEEKLRALGVDP